MFVGMELVKELVETVLLTGRLKEHSPVSLLLVSTPEAGKTRVLLETPCISAVMFTDITGKAIQDVCKMNPEKTHFILNDLVAVVSHKQSVSKYTMSMLNAMTEEGILAVAYPGQIETFKNGKRGVIAALTLDLVKDERHWWNKIGFTSRMMPFCYQHGEEVLVKIKEVMNRDGDGLASKEFSIPVIPVSVTITHDFSTEIQRISDAKAKELNELGLRRLKQFRAVVRAHALRRTRNWKDPSVNQTDVDFLKRIFPYINYDKGMIL